MDRFCPNKLKALYQRLAFLLLFSSSLCLAKVNAQTQHKVSGTVLDSLKMAISDVNVQLITTTDTLKAISDKEGKFLFRNVKSESFVLQLSIMGYKSYAGKYSIEKGSKQLELNPIILAMTGTMLKEVNVKAKINPVRVMTDTIEYNAGAFQVLQGDRVSDLLKQLPGVDVDNDDNVTTMGKEMTKLRVNGKDFFTNNVKDFISKLPASIVAKIQVIDDYGDEANFTGIKVGEPRKMLNIVTKDDINKGYFGYVGINGGTSNQVSMNGNMNIWKENEQIGSNLNLTRADNGAGQSRNSNASINLRKSINKTTSTGFNYSFYNNSNDNQNISFIETVNTLGTIYSANESQGNNKGNNHTLNWDFQKNAKKNFVNASVGMGLGQSEGINGSSSKQSGIIRQDLINQSSSDNHSPSLNGNLNWSRKLQKKGSSLSASLNFRTNFNKGNQGIISNTLYYNAISGVLAKDSLLNRLVKSNSNNNNIGGTINYAYALKKPKKDTLANRSINTSYNFSIGTTNNDILTYVTDKANNVRYVDSLSTQYSSLFLSQNIGISYAYNSKKMNYTIGGSIRPSTLLGDYENLNVKINNTNINYAPTINVSYRFKPTQTLSIRYNGNSNSPSANQLQPVRNTQNLQNIIVGNPNLKPSFSNTLNASYNTNNVKSGKSLQASLGYSLVQNQIVSNVVLLRDTLNSLRQETRYENADGTYNINGNYFYNIPLVKNKFTISIRGNFTYGHNIVFTDNVRSINKALNLSQAVSSNVNLKKLTLSGAINYGLNANSYSLIKGNARDIETWNFTFSGRATVLKTFKFSTNLSKRINTGYAIANTNPFLIGATLNKSFLKSKTINASIAVFDLLNQGNNLSRYVSGNMTVDSRSNQITRYVTFGISYNLSKFGKGGGNVFRSEEMMIYN